MLRRGPIILNVRASSPGSSKLWSTTVGLVMEDAQLCSRKSPQPVSAELGRIGQLVVHRTPDWVKSTAGKLSVLLKKIVSCTSAHLHWRVRLEMVELADHLLAKCSQSLREWAGPLLEALVGAVNDEEPRVRERFASITRFEEILVNCCKLFEDVLVFMLKV